MAPFAYTGRDAARASIVMALAARQSPDSTTGRDTMAVGLQPSQLLAAHLQVVRQDGLTAFKFTQPAQARLDDLLTRRKEGGLTIEEQAEPDALAELDRSFTYRNALLAFTHGA